MPYKSRFRRVHVPNDAKKLRALGTDANSLRSVGAALYRADYGTPGFRATGLFIYLCWAAEMLEKLVPAYLPSLKQGMGYIMDGARRVAKEVDGERALKLLYSELQKA